MPTCGASLPSLCFTLSLIVTYGTFAAFSLSVTAGPMAWSVIQNAMPSAFCVIALSMPAMKASSLRLASMPM